MSMGLLGFILFGSLVFFLALGVPVGFTMGGISIILGIIFWDGLSSVDGFVLGSYSKITESILTAIPLYIFMASVLMYSDLADDLYEAVYRWFSGIKGGLAAGTTIIAAIFAAMVGIASVATATLGMVARPSMLSRGYDDKLTIGIIMAGGTLGSLIPPSIVMIVYSAESGVSAGSLFMAGIIPGILAALIFIIYAIGLSIIYPNKGPNVPKEERFTWAEKFKSLKSILIPLVVIIIVLGSIYLGVATPTEAGAVGAVGSIIAAATLRKLTLENIKKMILMTVRLNGLIFWILIGAVAYARIVSVTGVGQALAGFIVDSGFSALLVIISMLVLFLILGMLIDTVAVLLITAPLFLPALEVLGFDLLWFGVLFVIAVCVGNISPPFGVSIFVMRGVIPDISIKKIYVATFPFIGLLLIMLILVFIFPDIALWLPDAMQ